VSIGVGLALLFAAPAGSHPGHGPTVVDVGEFKFAPDKVNVVQNDYVFWAWSQADTNHSVTADPGQAMTFDSDKGKSPSQVDHKKGDGFSVQFTKPGTYTYFCKVHSFMKGTVVVAESPDGPAPAPIKPKLSKVSARPSGRRLIVRFTVNEAVSMRALVRRPSGKLVKEFDFPGPPGANKRTLKLRSVKDGDYVLALIAVDSSTGSSSRTVKREISLS
jgi:plastocyanin